MFIMCKIFIKNYQILNQIFYSFVKKKNIKLF